MNKPHACGSTLFAPRVAFNSSGEALDMGAALSLVAAVAHGCMPCQDKYEVAVLDGHPDVVTAVSSMAFLHLETLARAVTGQIFKALGEPCGESGEFKVAPSLAPLLSPVTKAVYSMFEREDVPGAELLVREYGRAERCQVLRDAVETLSGAMSAA